MSVSVLEEWFARQLLAIGTPPHVREHRFAPPRRWRYDFAWPEHLVAVEIDGAVYAGGRHTRGAGYEKDLEKLNTAALLGWTVLRFSRSLIQSGEASRMTAQALNRRMPA